MGGIRRWAVALLASLLSVSAFAETISVAVASNFKEPLSAIADRYEDLSGNTVRLSAASTGKHYAQIVNGAPFDIFLAADSDRPKRLVDEGYAVAETRRTYALGALVLWAPASEGKDCEAALEAGEFSRLAIANPRTAPYGLAAEQVLESLGLASTYKPRLVTGENISQAMHFVDAGAAPAGLVAASHWLANQRREEGCHWLVPAELHEPIAQQVVLLNSAKGSPAALAFLTYLASDEVAEIIKSHGYLTDR